MFKRFFDITVSLILGILFLALLIILWPIVVLSSKGPFLHWSKRVGKDEILFSMPKIRTMVMGAPLVATHLLNGSNTTFTPIGGLLRKLSVDEIPQLYSVLKGDMSLVGPRPALHNQYDLIRLRNKKGISILRPGLSGWAQVNGRDELSIEKKVEYEEEYLFNRSFLFDLKIIWLTILKVLRRDNISH